MREKYPPRITNQRPVSRTPITGDMLVCAGGRWQVCYQARGKVEDRKITAWVYCPESRFFCEVGTEQYLIDLPQPNQSSFFDDQFSFSVEEVDRDGFRYSRLAGANCVTAATAAYDSLRRSNNRVIRIRQGFRLIRKSDQET